MRFLAGLIVGLIALGGYVAYQRYDRGRRPCLGLCGGGTTCRQGICVVAAPPPGKRRARKHRRRRGRRRRRAIAAPGAPALKRPRPGDLRAASRGPSLRGTDVVDFAEAEGGRELDQATIDAAIRRKDAQVVACIDRARGDYDIRGGRVTLGFRVERDGRVRKVRVTGPALLLRRGLYDCLRPLVTSLRFPHSSRSLVLTYPYALQ